ncbi:cyanophycinase [Blastomonas sp.]|uniref:cyanophycinase n=1 Tax=Blastomonas sp. TaxID=1909299 RepID=UPI002619B86B|nr:cyanophycinase [Blastomonas sp.]MDM7957425.1 cyanophycinase [Blastomonas sp.]
MKILCAALLAAASVSAFAETGTVVAVGGALADDNAAVFRALIDAMPDDALDIVVIPAASGSPGGSATRFADALARHGVDRRRVGLVHVAVIDDPETPDADESRWSGGASDPDEIAKIDRAGLIWFAGGDQARILAALVMPDGKDTPMLAAIRQRLMQGAVIGGTSAGAAVLGEHMIGCGSPDVALTAPVSRRLADCAATGEDAEGAPLVLAKGLGFLTNIVFDQHFSQRGRLTRLVRAVACIDADAVTGVGVDEDTGFVFSLANDMGHAVGRGTITLVDPSDGRKACDGAVMDNVRLARVPAKAVD